MADEIFELPPIDWNIFNLDTCNRCKLCTSRKQVVKNVIVPNCDIMFVGEAPGVNEDLSGIPFVGECGELLNDLLKQYNIDRDKCSIANVCCCRPPKNRPPEKDEVEACHTILDKAIEQANPKIIVPLGNTALKRITKNSGITNYNGCLLGHKNYPGKKIIPMVHPSFVLRDPKNKAYMEEAFRKINLMNDVNFSYTRTDVTFVDTYEKFDNMIKELSSSSYFALDIETSALLDYMSNHIVCISFSNKAGHAWVLPWVVGNDKFYEVCQTQIIQNKKRECISDVQDFCNLFKLDYPKYKWEGTDVRQRLCDLLGNPNISKILHNYAYDYKWLEYHGLKIEGQIFDTMILHFLIDETRGTHGLDDCTKRFLSTYGEYWKELESNIKSTKEESDSYALIPLSTLVPYAGTDADVTYQLFRIFMPMLLAEGSELVELLINFMMPLSRLLMQTQKNGMKIDINYLTEKEKLLDEEIKKIDLQLKQYADINYDSPKQLGYLLFTTLKLPVVERTKSNKPSTDADTLEVLANVHPIPKLLLNRRKLVKLKSTYFTGMRKFIWKHDGKVHPNFMQTGTETGRLSANSPNCQNLTRNPQPGDFLYDLGIKVRDLFINSHEDYYIVETDYSQAELRLLAEYSKDKALYTAFKEGRDPHAELAVRLYHKERVQEMVDGKIRAEDIVTKEERQKAKTANFSLAYGKSADNFARENGLSLEEGRYIHKVYWDTYTGIDAWKAEEVSKGKKQNYFKSFFGRRRRLPKINSSDPFIAGEAEREGINSVIQSQASDYTLYSTMKVCEQGALKKLRFSTISYVHDSAVYEVHKDDLQEFLTLLKQIMIHPPGVSILMDCDIKVGTRLGSLKEWTCIDNVWKEKVKK